MRLMPMPMFCWNRLITACLLVLVMPLPAHTFGVLPCPDASGTRLAD